MLQHCHFDSSYLTDRRRFESAFRRSACAHGREGAIYRGGGESYTCAIYFVSIEGRSRVTTLASFLILDLLARLGHVEREDEIFRRV